jgi:hypothetical protein
MEVNFWWQPCQVVQHNSNTILWVFFRTLSCECPIHVMYLDSLGRLILWKGRTALKQYISAKWHGLGIKLFKVCNLKNRIYSNIINDTGAKTKLDKVTVQNLCNCSDHTTGAAFEPTMYSLWTIGTAAQHYSNFCLNKTHVLWNCATY